MDKDEEMQKLPLQPPYYDMAPSESTAFTDKMVSFVVPDNWQKIVFVIDPSCICWRSEWSLEANLDLWIIECVTSL